MANPPLPPLLAPLTLREINLSSPHMRLPELRKATRFWTGQKTDKMPAGECEALLRRALEDDAAAARVVAELSPVERQVLAVYRRYGNTVDGAVLRVDLMARGILEVVEQKQQYMTWRRWKHNPIPNLSQHLVLLSADGHYPYWGFGGSGPETDQALPTYYLHPRMATRVEPAGPPPWDLAPLGTAPAALGARSFAETALDLAAVFRFLASRTALAMTKAGGLTTPALRALVKGQPMVADATFPIPDAQVLYLELLRGSGLALEGGNELRASPEAAMRFFTAPDACQAHVVARAWMESTSWADGLGVIRPDRGYYGSGWTLVRARRVLTWALGAAAATGDAWWPLAGFLDRLHQLHGHTIRFETIWRTAVAWAPPKPLDPQPPRNDQQAGERRFWFEHDGQGLANALMVTLPALGLIERGRMAPAGKPDCFRLTPLGRAVFGAPEVALPPETGEDSFLVVQPNFDVIAYLDRASARSAGFLGRMAESAARTGSVQAFRLTRDSVYLALESGLASEEVVDFLTRHNKGPLPPNVVQTLRDWSARRESLVVRSGLKLVAFPDQAARDGWLVGKKGTACGDRFVLLAPDAPAPRGMPLRVDHEGLQRRTLLLDEAGVVKRTEPLDLVQRARLGLLAEPEGDAFRLTAESVHRAARAGLKGERLENWLKQDLHGPIPPLLRFALKGWAGRNVEVQLGEAVLIHVPDHDLYQALLISPRVRQYLAGSLADGWLAVKRETRKEFAKVLAELRFKVDPALSHNPLPELPGSE